MRSHSLVDNAWSVSAGILAESLGGIQTDLERAGFPAALWTRRSDAWSHDRKVQETIANRLGWLGSPELMTKSVPRLEQFAERARADRFTDVVLLGMGGSSLAPEVLRATIGPRRGWPRFHMLDSTDPAAILAVGADPTVPDGLPIETTLFLLASKSGGTIEPNALAAYFRGRLGQTGVRDWGGRFVAITDEGTVLHELARREGFRDIFLNPSDIGGRYSALSFFGLVPAALMGLDVVSLLEWGLAMKAACQPERAVVQNPGVMLGAVMGAAARAGRDKLTLLLPPPLEAFGLWIEQLVAESTGKQGTGIVPIVGEAIGAAEAYGDDRLFVALRLLSANTAEAEGAGGLLERLRETGAPTVTIDLPDVAAIGAEFMRWEIATATAGAILGVNPFDEPNVQQAKDATRALLDARGPGGGFPSFDQRRAAAGPTLALSNEAADLLRGAPPERFLTLVRPGDYVAVLAYLGPDRRLIATLERLRKAIRDRTGAATTLGFGPRYLHSTGQLHKGGPNTGVFLLVTASPVEDVGVPGEAFSFGTLELAQALGDFASLEATGRRALHVHLAAPDADRLDAIAAALGFDRSARA